MPKVRIIQDYKPAEGWRVGQIVDISDVGRLLEEGKVVLVDEEGQEMERPGVLHCPICPYDAKTAIDLANHILGMHPRKGTKPMLLNPDVEEDQPAENFAIGDPMADEPLTEESSPESQNSRDSAEPEVVETVAEAETPEQVPMSQVSKAETVTPVTSSEELLEEIDKLRRQNLAKRAQRGEGR